MNTLLSPDWAATARRTPEQRTRLQFQRVKPQAQLTTHCLLRAALTHTAQSGNLNRHNQTSLHFLVPFLHGVFIYCPQGRLIAAHWGKISHKNTCKELAAGAEGGNNQPFAPKRKINKCHLWLFAYAALVWAVLKLAGPPCKVHFIQSVIVKR